MNRLVIFKNYDLTIKNKLATDYVNDFQNQLYDGEEKLLDVFFVD